MRLYMIALLRKRHEIIKYLLSTGADVNSVDDEGVSVFMYAVDTDDINIVDLIWKTGADRNTIAHDGSCAIYHANNVEIIKTLIKDGANINYKNSAGATPLHNAVMSYGLRTIYFLMKSGADIHSQDKRNHTTMIYAAVSHNIGAMRLLIKAGADLYVKDITGNTAIDYIKQQNTTDSKHKVGELTELYNKVQSKRLNKEDKMRDTCTNYEYDI